MYLIRHKSTHQILHRFPGNLSMNLSGEQIYSGFDPKTMEVLKSENDVISDTFKVDKQGNILEKTRKEKILHGDISFEQIFDTANLTNSGLTDMVATDTNISENFDPVVFVLEHKLVDRKQKCQQVLVYLKARLAHKIKLKYPIGKELKIIKGYMDWSDEGKPKKDPRQTNYQMMHSDIAEIKEGNKRLSKSLKTLLNKLKK